MENEKLEERSDIHDSFTLFHLFSYLKRHKGISIYSAYTRTIILLVRPSNLQANLCIVLSPELLLNIEKVAREMSAFISQQKK